MCFFLLPHLQFLFRWSKIASHFPGRTDNEIKNHWNTRIKKRLKQLGLDPVTHKPIEEKDEVNEKNDTVPDSASSKQQEESNGERGDTLDTVQEKQTGGEMTSHEASTDDLLNEMLDGSSDLELGLLMNQQTKTSSNTYSPSFSLEDSLNPSMAESSSLQDDCLQQWVDCTVDSLLSWDNFNHLEQELFFLENSHWTYCLPFCALVTLVSPIRMIIAHAIKNFSKRKCKSYYFDLVFSNMTWIPPPPYCFAVNHWNLCFIGVMF